MIVLVAVLTLLVLAALFMGAAAVVHLEHLQAAIERHRASAGAWDDDNALYRVAGLGPAYPPTRPPVERPRETTFMRGDRFQ